MARATKVTKQQSEHLQEVYGIAMITVGVLLLVSVFSSSSGIAGRFVQETLKWLFGIARYGVPFGMIGGGFGLIMHKVDPKSEATALGGGARLSWVIIDNPSERSIC